MKSPMFRSAVLLVALAATTMTGACGPTRGSDPKESTMTPAQAYEQLKQDLFAAAQAAIPGQTPSVEDETKDAPCGGSAGTDHSKVKSDIYVSSGDPKLTRTAGDMAQAVASHLKDHGWNVQPIERNADNSVIVYAGKSGFSVRANLVKGNKNIKLAGGTPCLDNPEK